MSFINIFLNIIPLIFYILKLKKRETFIKLSDTNDNFTIVPEGI
jgi:uncharacterized membrane-anchored protein YitT (DUF2179 family)